MSTKPNDTDTTDEQRDKFTGEYNAFGTMGRTTSNPRILVWLHGREDMKFGIHHGTQYGVEEVFGWLMNNVRSVPFSAVETTAIERNEELVIHLGPNHEPARKSATEVFLDG